MKHRPRQQETAFSCDQKVDLEIPDLDIESKVPKESSNFDIDEVISKIEKKVAGELSDSESEPDAEIRPRQAVGQILSNVSEPQVIAPPDIKIELSDQPAKIIKDPWHSSLIAKHQISHLMSEEDTVELSKSRAKIIRYYISFTSLFHTIQYILSSLNGFNGGPGPLWIIGVGILATATWTCIILSFIKDVEYCLYSFFPV